MAKRSPNGLPSGLFTQQDCTNCLRHLDELRTWPELAQKAAACGVDVSGLSAIRDDVARQLQAIRDHFMKGM